MMLCRVPNRGGPFMRELRRQGDTKGMYDTCGMLSVVSAGPVCKGQ